MSLPHFPHKALTGLPGYLVEDQLLTVDHALLAMQKAEEQHTSFTHFLVKSGILSSAMLYDYLVGKFNLPTFDLKQYDPTWLQSSNLNPELIYRYRILPLQCHDMNLPIALADPTDHAAISAISFHSGLRIQTVLAAEEDLAHIIDTYCRPALLYTQMENALSQITPLELSPLISSMKDEENDEPVIEYVDHLIQSAVEKNISDIHIEPRETHCRIRFRLDGELYETSRIPTPLALRIATRLKVMAQLNIAEKRLPQDGRIHFHGKIQPENQVDIRINTCPTLFGEKIALRILNREHMRLNMEELGLTISQLTLLKEKLTQPQGLILVTGPTGSGKTVTLYSAIQYLNQETKNILSVEDPIEIELNGINQVNINPKIGLDFATILRNFLRQDPDIILVGEIRDQETAHVALQAAQTGHLVLASLHTNSAIDCINRLTMMNISAYQLVNSISLMLAQRLLRKLCLHCKQQKKITEEEKKILTAPFIENSFHPVGCRHCRQGYKGRIGIFELIPMTEPLTHHILSWQSTYPLIDNLKHENTLFLKDSALEKVKAGMTSIAEIKRILPA